MLVLPDQRYLLGAILQPKNSNKYNEPFCYLEILQYCMVPAFKLRFICLYYRDGRPEGEGRPSPDWPETEFREKWCDHDSEYINAVFPKMRLRTSFSVNKHKEAAWLLQCLFTKKRLLRKTAFLYSAFWWYLFAKWCDQFSLNTAM